MGFPKVLFSRLRKTKGTRLFVVRNYYAAAFLTVTSIIGFASRYTPLFEEFRRDVKEGVYDNSPEFEHRKFLFLNVALPQTADQLSKDKEEERTFMQVITRAGPGI